VSPRTVTLYRVLAYTTGVVLLIFTAEIVLKYAFHVEGFEFIAVVHGWIYLFYFLVSAYLAIALRWSWRWAVPVVLAGTIPFASFVAERKVVNKVRAEHPELVSPG
jgi:integral membrane protein